MAHSLFAFGSNGHGQLGIGSDIDTSLPRPVQFVPPLAFTPRDHHAHCHHQEQHLNHDDGIHTMTRPFHAFAAGGNHTALITADDSRLLYMTGSNKDHESLLEEPTQVFRRVELSHAQQQQQQQQQREIAQQVEQVRWRSVACGWAFTIAVTEPSPRPHLVQEQSQEQHVDHRWCNTAFSWGSGAFGELGLGPGVTKTGYNAVTIRTGLLSESSLHFLTLSSSDRFEILQVKAGLRHVLMLVKQIDHAGRKITNILMGWGSNRQGQLGILERARSRTGSQTGGEAGVSDVEEHLPPFTEKELRGKFLEPTRILISKEQQPSTLTQESAEVVDMACGQNHSLVLFTDGTVYASGLNKYGQLGPRRSTTVTTATTTATATGLKDRPQEFRIGFEQVLGIPFVDSISCGWNHNAVMDTRPILSNGNTGRTVIYLWGRNDHGQLGSETPALRAVDVDLSGAGLPGIVQIRIPNESDDQKEKDYEEIVSYSCGSEHTLAMTRSGACYSWGWNEHGNCGSGFNDSIDGLQDVQAPRKVRFETLPEESSSSNKDEQRWVSGGYGSSWVWT
ncbi:hypothetical protein BGZ99_010395 [Dissophora globulifera]|uniref:Uncharacterized protein n=1 Tax=Dissophora globulifera TaxID=979702 RepID=A0A9P6RU23_9FUNG|nr:hypothetical protein BGZ99_010395 [Dissophora globulifera]